MSENPSYCLQNSARACLLASLTTIALCSPAASKPNIIHIMVDDAGVGDFSSYWQNSPVQTPNLDALATAGMKFTNAYAGATSCAPSRSALLTGKHGGHTYLRSNNGNVSIRDREVTIAEVLKTAGYATSGYGKYGLGAPGTPGAAERQGFDEFVGYYDQVHAHSHYPDRLFDSGKPLLIPENSGFSEPETGLISNDRVHAHSIIFDRMKTFMKTNIEQDQPFYSWGAWTPPHRKSTLPLADADPGGLYHRYAQQPGWDDFDKIQAGFVTWIDQQVGELLETVNDPNGDGDTSDSVADNTLIIFTSDNGGWQGAHNWDRNRETVDGVEVNLRGAKEGPYEGGLRTPMIAYWPGKIQAGAESELITYFPDMMPTFAELAGAQAAMPGDVDGISIVPTLTGQGQQTQRDGIYFEDLSYNDNGAPEQVVRMSNWKLIRKHNGNLEMYNLASDPGETTNEANNLSHAATRAQLVAFMDSNHSTMTAQFSVDPSNAGTSNSVRDGAVAFGIRSPAEPRDWKINESGDAQALPGILKNPIGDGVRLYLDDLHVDFELAMNVERTGTDSPQLLVELMGNSGFVYYTASYDTSQQGEGTKADVTLDLNITTVSPNKNDITGDLNQLLTLRISHDGSPGKVLVNSVQLDVPDEALFGDLNGNGAIDLADWQLFRADLFSDLTGIGEAEAYRRGDLDGDGQNNEVDFELFKTAYEMANGLGSFVKLSKVPEPSSLMLSAIAVSVVGTTRNRIEADDVREDCQ